jgi:hypothetical protein
MQANASFARAITSRQASKAIQLNLVSPTAPSGRFLGSAGQAGFTEVGEGYATQQHAV